VRAAVDELRELPETEVVRVSTLRNTDPVGFLDQPQFLNGVVELETGLSGQILLDALLEIERVFGRDRSSSPPQGPRTLDLDLLLYGEQIIDEPGLDPALEVPGVGRVETLLAELDS
jgi:2-amino-4-hydroxy-6-hydroxymethyldihydropteridine diphosphokinase